ncbi:MAG: hypothetical protein HYX92_21660 [Chloroflexi bacterium]|nr:hypothetical protein [Chloroflexota bacterium]
MGIPSVGIVSSGFTAVWEARHRAMGMDVLPRVRVGPALTEIPPEQVREEVLAHADDVFAGLTEQPRVPTTPAVASDQLLRYEGHDFLDALRILNGDFIHRGWGDGLPIVPPTPEAVEAMVAGTSRQRDEVVIIMDPGRGIATVEKIAINCVMAGCRPEHLPVVIAAIEAMSEPLFGLTAVAQSTGPQTPLLVINGPIRQQIGINSGICALGPGSPSWVNTVIGRAVRLVMMNVGHAYPGVMDMDTIGSPNKYSMCVGENEEANPWGPLHVERGFRSDESTVTVFPCGSCIDVPDLVSCTPEAVLTTFAYTANSPLSPTWFYLQRDTAKFEHLLMICPDHARIIADAGWTKNDVRRFMFHNARIPVGVIKNPTRPSAVAPGWKWVLNQPDDALVPVVREPGDFHIVVVGAASGKSAYVWDWAAPITKPIRF